MLSSWALRWALPTGYSCLPQQTIDGLGSEDCPLLAVEIHQSWKLIPSLPSVQHIYSATPPVTYRYLELALLKLRSLPPPTGSFSDKLHVVITSNIVPQYRILSLRPLHTVYSALKSIHFSPCHLPLPLSGLGLFSPDNCFTSCPRLLPFLLIPHNSCNEPSET